MDYQTIDDPDGIADQVIASKLTGMISTRIDYEHRIGQCRAAIALLAATGGKPDGTLEPEIAHFERLLETLNVDIARLQSRMRTPLTENDVELDLINGALETFERAHIEQTTLRSICAELGDEAGADLAARQMLAHQAIIEQMHARGGTGIGRNQATRPDDEVPGLTDETREELRKERLAAAAAEHAAEIGVDPPDPDSF